MKGSAFPVGNDRLTTICPFGKPPANDRSLREADAHLIVAGGQLRLKRR